MSQIVFPSLADDVRVPFAYAEFDGSGASEDLSLNPFNVLISGQMLAAGTAEPYQVYRPMSKEQGQSLFGRGSMLARMVECYLAANPKTRMMVIPTRDAPVGVAASGSIHSEGVVTSAAPLNLYIGGQRVRAATRHGTTASEAAIALRDAVNAAPDLSVTARTEDATVVLTAKHKGECGNDLDLRWNNRDEVSPEGLRSTIAPMSGGAGNPEAEEIIASMGSDRYHMIAWPWRDKANIDVLKEEMDSRWGPLRQIDGQVIVVAPGNFGQAVTYSGSHNNKHLTVLPGEGSPTPSWEDAAASMGILAYYGNQDPARGFLTLKIPGVAAPHRRDRFEDFPERNQGLFEGLSSRYVDADGNVCFSNVITTHRINPLGAEDKAFLSLNSPLTLSYLRYDWNNYLKLKYPRWKLVGDEDGNLYGTSAMVMTPKLGKSEAIARFQRWLEAAYVQGSGQFKRDLLTARNPRNENRLDWFMRPHVANQFNIAGTLIKHLV
jgi:phage tail sheath gpL-like